MPTAPSINGKANGKARHLVGPAKTLGYKPIDDRWFRRPRDLPPFDFWAIQAMLMEPMVRLGLAMRAAPLMAAEFAYKEGEDWKPGIVCEDEVVGAFILRQLKTVWQQLDLLIDDQVWGWTAGEMTLRLTEQNTVEIDKVLPRRSQDTRLLEKDGMPFGVRVAKVEGVSEGYVDLPFPLAFFHAHRPSPGQHYGTSIMEGAYSPWADLWLEGGALGVRRKFMFKDAYGGADMTYPEGTTMIGTTAVNNEQIAMEIVQQLEAGGVTTRPSDVDPVTQKEKWTITRATVPSNPQHILQYPKDLATEILRGMEIPDDVLESTDGAGGAWAGKTVPMQAFYNGLETWLRCKLRAIKPTIDFLIILNFGRKYWYELATKPLALQAMEQQGEKKAPDAGTGQNPGQSPMGNQPQQQGQQGTQPQGGQPQFQGQQRMGLDPVAAVGQGVLSATELVKAARTLMAIRLSADFKEDEHPRNNDGEFAAAGKISGKSTKGKKPKKTKLTILQAFDKLHEHGWELGHALPWKPGDKSPVYAVKHIATGEVHYKTGQQIAKMIEEKAAGRIIRMRVGEGEPDDSGSHWITIGGRKDGDDEHSGGFPVQIDKDGNILKSGGPQGIVGKHVTDVADHFWQERTETKRKDNATKQQASDRGTKVGARGSWQQIVKTQAAARKMSPEVYEQIASDVWKDTLAHHAEREAAKEYARKLTGLHAGDIERLENQGHDYTKIKGSDIYAEQIASQYPGVFTSDEPQQELWDLIKEGKQPLPSKTSDEFVGAVEEYLGPMRGKKAKKDTRTREQELEEASYFSVTPKRKGRKRGTALAK